LPEEYGECDASGLAGVTGEGDTKRIGDTV
jgi:hypothetical protein